MFSRSLDATRSQCSTSGRIHAAPSPALRPKSLRPVLSMRAFPQARTRCRLFGLMIPLARGGAVWRQAASQGTLSRANAAPQRKDDDPDRERMYREIYNLMPDPLEEPLLAEEGAQQLQQQPGPQGAFRDIDDDFAAKYSR